MWEVKRDLFPFYEFSPYKQFAMERIVLVNLDITV